MASKITCLLFRKHLERRNVETRHFYLKLRPETLQQRKLIHTGQEQMNSIVCNMCVPAADISPFTTAQIRVLGLSRKIHELVCCQIPSFERPLIILSGCVYVLLGSVVSLMRNSCEIAKYSQKCPQGSIFDTHILLSKP